MISRPLARLVGALGLVAAVGLASCTEDIDGSASCPLLCPPQSITTRDTVIEGVAYDTSVAGYPGIGLEPTLLLARRGDSLDTRVFLRFDSLPSTFRAAGNDSAITRVDTATLLLRLAFPVLPTAGQVVVEAYDVDTALANDTLPSSLLPLFRPDRLLATELVSPASVADSTVRIVLDPRVVLRKVTDKARLRVGLRVRNGTNGQVQFIASDGGTAPRINLRVTRDTSVTPLPVALLSKTPEGSSLPPSQLADYVFAAVQPAPAPATVLAMGGMRGQRGYLRFSIPRRIADSSTVVRATLELTQFPYRGPDAGDTTTLVAHTTLGTGVVTDIRRVISLLGATGPDTLRLVPRDSGRRALELAGLVAQWRAFSVDSSGRAVVLRMPTEQQRPAELRFFSRRAASADLRPRLRLVYVPRTTFGLP